MAESTIAPACFVVNRSLTVVGLVPSVYGPFASLDLAIAAAEKIVIPGTYVIYGGAAAAHQVVITAPTVTSKAL
ncbi:hypothetical protein OOZ54_12915 [Rhodopseudomonas palustris]|uniref:hypothetical protein n=1 Tax=Rhodopseudomonas palustris TaxID=1076 RepID=UPI0022EFE573|nr:hypothetical protein [Rhodopseudomonas palustris]WBU27596.1 hypothetical protein OOZ54_12915 [Rhodopseudomonas palustris]